MNEYFLKILIRERQREFQELVRRGNLSYRQQAMKGKAEQQVGYALQTDMDRSDSDRKINRRLISWENQIRFLKKTIGTTSNR